MKNNVFLAVALCSVLPLTACGDKIEDLGLPPPSIPDGCAVHLFATTEFQKDASNDIIEGPGKFSDLIALPGATQDWTNRVKSIVVGKEATVQIWEREKFEGPTKMYQSSEFQTNVEKFHSMSINCSN